MSLEPAELSSRGFLIADDKSFPRNMIQDMLLRLCDLAAGMVENAHLPVEQNTA